VIATSWVRDQFANGRKRFKVYAMHVPVTQVALAGAPAVIGEASIEVPNLEVARILHAAVGQMLQAQPPEILSAAP